MSDNNRYNSKIIYTYASLLEKMSVVTLVFSISVFTISFLLLGYLIGLLMAHNGDTIIPTLLLLAGGAIGYYIGSLLGKIPSNLFS